MALLIASCFTTLANEKASDSAGHLLRIWKGNNRILIPELAPEQVPGIDGIIAESEWQVAQKSIGFVRQAGHLIGDRHGYVYLAHDATNLYVAVRTSAMNNDPGGGLAAKAMQRDSGVYDDDSLEIYVVADSDTNTVRQIVFNSIGTIYDRKTTVIPRHHDTTWDIKDIKVGTRVESGWWDLEVALPLAELGLEPGSKFKMNVCRNWSELGASAMQATSSYADQSNMLNATLSQSAVPIVQQNEVGHFDEGSWKLRLSAYNPGKHPCVLAAMLRHYLYPKKDGKVQSKMVVDTCKDVVVMPGESAELEIDFECTDSRPRWFTTVLYDQKSGRHYYARLVHGRKEVALGRHPATTSFELGSVGSGVCWYYPGYNTARVRFSFKSSFIPVGVKAWTDGNPPQIVKQDGKYYSGLLPVSKIPGEYHFHAEVEDDQGALHSFPLLCSVEKKKFVWEGNNYGQDKIILPPFKPLQCEGAVVKGLLNQYTLNHFGLWESLLAQEQEILAAPMRVVMVQGGKECVWKSGKLKAPAVEYEGYSVDYQSSVVADIGIRLSTSVKIEYDGFTWIKLTTASDTPQSIESLKLQIPLKNSAVPYFHVISNTIRSNPSGYTPDGEGVVWDGTELKRASPAGTENMHPQLVPYIWLGDIERGLCWFLDSSYGYRLDRKKSAMRLIRQGETLLLEVDLINRSYTLLDKNTVEFGMQATPVKTIESRLKGMTRDPRGHGIDGELNAMFIHGRLLGLPYNWSKLAYNEDYSLFRKITDVIATGNSSGMEEVVNTWLHNYQTPVVELLSKVHNIKEPINPEWYRNFHGNFQTTISKVTGRKSLPIKYSDPRLTLRLEEEADYFKAEWWNTSVQNYFGAWRTSLVPSNIDFLIYGYYREIENGMHGIYLDDVFLMPATNPDTVARIDDEGEVHSALSILGIRELVKRISVLQHQFNRYPRVLEVHMTNALLIPCFSLATTQLGWEMDFGETPLPQRFRIDDIRATSLGTQLGADSFALGGIRRKVSPTWKEWQANMKRLTRSHLALSLPHGVKIKFRLFEDADRVMGLAIYQIMSDFGCWSQEVKFVPCWQNDGAITLAVPDDKILLASYHLPGKVMVIAGNLKEEPQELRLAIEWGRAGVSAKSRVSNMENNELVDLSKFILPGYDFCILEIKE